jgi:hypothetical protein
MADCFDELGDFLEFVVSGTSAYLFPFQQHSSEQGIRSLSKKYDQDTNKAWPADEPPDKHNREYQPEWFRDERLELPKSGYEPVSTKTLNMKIIRFGMRRLESFEGDCWEKES